MLAGAANGLLGICGPFTDVAADAFCPFVLEIFYLGITTGTTATTYDPGANVTRLQMAAFLSRTVDGVLKRGSRRAILDQFWTTQNATVLGITTLGNSPGLLKSDGADIWVADNVDGTVSRVRASDAKLLETWTGAPDAWGVLSAMGRIFISGVNSSGPGELYRIDPTQPAGAVTTLATNLGNGAAGIAFDGARIWTANSLGGGSVSIITPGATIPWTVTTVTTGFGETVGAVFDGSNIWVTSRTQNRLFKLDSSGVILQTVTVGTGPGYAVFDGTNIWVPNFSENSISVVRASSGLVLATLTGNGLTGPPLAAFDGQRVLVTSVVGNRVSLWKAADLTPITTVSTGADTSPWGACSDGIHFWIALDSGPPGQLARF
ncbi:MAG TPA: S-layer homology domain-containing protein [Thermoanaerobaculia bacterium]|nr:S-layer homology domain-containing protein [Thermoanaerobaculia bacterium]